MFLCFEKVLSEKWISSNDGETSRYKSFYKLNQNTLDYIVLGASYSYFSINPMLIYIQEGYTGYNLGSPGQTIELSYSWLQEACKYQVPEYVFLDISSLFYNENDKVDEAIIKGMTDMRLSLQKIKAAYECKLPEMSMMELLSPMYAFHERWKGLEQKDFSINGYYYLNKGTFFTFMQRSDTAKVLADRRNYLVFEDDSFYIERKGISKQNKIVFDKIYLFCKERGITLIPMRSPTINWGYLEEDVINEMLLEYGLPLLDMNSAELNIIWNLDSADSGEHVNYWGSCKASDYLKGYLVNEQRLTDHRNEKKYEQWDIDLINYKEFEEKSLRTNKEDVLNYFQVLAKNKEDLYIIFSVKDEMCLNWSRELQNNMERLGFSSDFFNEIQNSYIGIVDAGNVLLDKFSEYPMKANLKAKINSGDWCSVKITSGGLLYGNISEIYIDDIDYSLNKRGLNIVVIDKNEGKVISSFSVDTWSSEWEFEEKIWDEELWKQYQKRGEQLLQDGIYAVSPVSDRECASEVLKEKVDYKNTLQLEGINDDVSQNFRLKYVGNGLYEICSAYSGEYLTVENFGNAPGTDIALVRYSGLSNQKWYIYENSDKQYTILSHYNRLMLDVVGEEGELKFQMNENSNGDEQQFIFNKLNVS